MTRLWLARAWIGLVLAVNLQCALLFIALPAVYAPGFELAGVVGEAVIRSLGVLFLMWNVPYAFAAWHPRRFATAHLEAIVMQAIGVLGEALIWLGLPAGHAVLQGSLERFLVFDSAGLVLLLLAFGLLRGKGAVISAPA